MKVTLYLPTTSTARDVLLGESVEAARYNLGIDIDEEPIDTRAADALGFSSRTNDMVARLLSNGYSMDNGIQLFFVQKDICANDLAWCFGATHGNMIIISDYLIWNSGYSDAGKKAMLAYSKTLANRIFQSGIFDEFKHELEYSSYVNLSVADDKPERVESKNANDVRQNEINKEFESAIKKSMKRYFGMDVDVKINKFKI